VCRAAAILNWAEFISRSAAGVLINRRAEVDALITAWKRDCGSPDKHGWQLRTTVSSLCLERKGPPCVEKTAAAQD